MIEISSVSSSARRPPGTQRSRRSARRSSSRASRRTAPCPVPAGERIRLVVGLEVRRRVELEDGGAGRHDERARRVVGLLELEIPRGSALGREPRQIVEPLRFAPPLGCQGGRYPHGLRFSSRGCARHAAARRAASGRRAARARPCSPLARSRSCIARKGSSDWGSSFIASHGSPLSSMRAGRDSTVSSSGWIASMSSQPSGVETCAPGRARTHQAPNTVLCGAFWLKSTKIRSPRSSFHHCAVIRSGRRRSSSRATATAANRTW